VDDDYLYVVMDYISGGEMFDHLIKNRFGSGCGKICTRSGIGVVRADLKPEHLILSSEQE
jgi:hypothetical protein